jgi:hypothetical protein
MNRELRLFLRAAVTFFLILGTTSCASVPHIPRLLGRATVDYSAVPRDALQQAADLIEKIVAEGRRDADLSDVAGITVNTPEILQAIRTRAARIDLVNAVLDSGFAYEQNNGLLCLIRNSAYKRATTSRQRDQNALMVMGENNNRWTLYEKLIEANHWPSRALGAVQDAFHRARVAQLRPGQKYQDESGNILTK